MEKIENEKIRDYAIELAINTFQPCKLFTQVFGKDFVRKRAIINLSKVYTNEFSRTVSGYHSSLDASVTLCENTRNVPPLTIEELKKDKKKLATLLHEMLHAILTKTKQECKHLKLQYGTGMLERYTDSQEVRKRSK